MERSGAEDSLTKKLIVDCCKGGKYETPMLLAVMIGAWQIQEQFNELAWTRLSVELSCLFNKVQINDVQSSLLCPVRQSASPHHNIDMLMERRRSTPMGFTKYVDDFLSITHLIYESARLTQNVNALPASTVHCASSDMLLISAPSTS